MDKIIKKRKNWYTSSEPHFFSSAPKKPEKEITTTKLTEVARINSFNDNSFKLSEIKLPENIEFKDLIVSWNMEYGYGGDSDTIDAVIFNVSEDVTSPNKDYKKQLEYYNKHLERYHAEKAAFKEELEEYKIWRVQEEARQLQKQLENAEKLLKKHGKLKEKSNG